MSAEALPASQQDPRDEEEASCVPWSFHPGLQETDDALAGYLRRGEPDGLSVEYGVRLLLGVPGNIAPGFESQSEPNSHVDDQFRVILGWGED
jgi:hypothetical protein